MAEWLYEQGIGEERAILVEDGTIIEAAIELPDGLRAGSIVDARLTTILVAGRRGIATLASGEEALLEPITAGLTEGAALRVEVVREAVPEAGRAKLAKVRVTNAAVRDGPSLRERIAATGAKVSVLRTTDPDRFEEAGWSELLEQAGGADIRFDDGALRMSVTPAMTLFDVDGSLASAQLAVAGAAAVGRAIRRLAIGGSIGIDLPTLSARPDRQAAAAALDAVLPQPFERTAVNGFGFLQLVRRKERPSLPELVQADPVGAAARALLRRAERTPGIGERLIAAAPAVVARIEAQSEWLAELNRRSGVAISLRADPALAISAGHVHSAQI